MRLLALLELVIWDPSMLADWTVKFRSPKLSDQPRPVGNKKGD
ncbi:hypothetical protein ACJW30_09G154600 [Castanea mollissima]